MAPNNRSNKNNNEKRGRGRPKKDKQGRPKKSQEPSQQVGQREGQQQNHDQQNPQEVQRETQYTKVELDKIESQLERCDSNLDLLSSVALIRHKSDMQLEQQEQQQDQQEVQVQQGSQDTNKEIEEIESRLQRCDTTLELLSSVALIRLESEVKPSTLAVPSCEEIDVADQEVDFQNSSSSTSTMRGSKRKLEDIGMYMNYFFYYNL